MTYEPVSTLHIGAAIVALASGGAVLASRKGTARHRLTGGVYVAAMLVLNLTALSIYRLTGAFGPFHIAALVSLAGLAFGMAPALRRPRSRHWLYTHLMFMSWSYIGLLAAAAAELAVRVPAVPFWQAVIGSSVGICVLGGYVLARRTPGLLAVHGLTAEVRETERAGAR